MPARSLTHPLKRCELGVLAMVTPLRRLSNQSASKTPASSTLISGTVLGLMGVLTEAERTGEEVWEGSRRRRRRRGRGWIDED